MCYSISSDQWMAIRYINVIPFLQISGWPAGTCMLFYVSRSVVSTYMCISFSPDLWSASTYIYSIPLFQIYGWPVCKYVLFYVSRSVVGH